MKSRIAPKISKDLVGSSGNGGKLGGAGGGIGGKGGDATKAGTGQELQSLASHMYPYPLPLMPSEPVQPASQICSFVRQNESICSPVGSQTTRRPVHENAAWLGLTRAARRVAAQTKLLIADIAGGKCALTRRRSARAVRSQSAGGGEADTMKDYERA